MITDTMNIGSGDVFKLMMGKQTKGYKEFMQSFVTGEKPHYNALNSPIDACRTGAILEGRYLFNVGPDYVEQYKAVSKEMNVFKASLDFTSFENGEVVHFIELKTIKEEVFDQIKGMSYSQIKKKFKKYYNQVQEQLLCTGLKDASLVFVCVFSYDDDENYKRIIKDEECIEITILRDEKVIEDLKKRGQIFQDIKDAFIGYEPKEPYIPEPMDFNQGQEPEQEQEQEQEPEVRPSLL